MVWGGTRKKEWMVFASSVSKYKTFWQDVLYFGTEELSGSGKITHFPSLQWHLQIVRVCDIFAFTDSAYIVIVFVNLNCSLSTL